MIHFESRTGDHALGPDCCRITSLDTSSYAIFWYYLIIHPLLFLFDLERYRQKILQS